MQSRLFSAKPYIIAEVGSNWHSLDDCLVSIKCAAQAGADAVKFQLFTHKSLYGYDDGLGMLPELPREWLPHLASAATSRGIEFLCTAFSEEEVDLVDPYVPAHKVASSDFTHIPLLRHIKSKGKPVILSCGASSDSEIEAVVAEMKDYPAVVLMYCHSAYPARWHNLFRIHQLDDLNIPLIAKGYSDHTRDVIYAPLSAHLHFDAQVIEKHFCLESITGTPDAPHSLNEYEFKAMVQALRGNCPMENPEEEAMYLRHNRRAVALKDISPCDKFVYGDNYGFYRVKEDDLSGLSGLLVDKIEGSRSTYFIKPGETIVATDVEGIKLQDIKELGL